ncbi:PREDICTED: uncharacterized membrane protein At1g06890 isoform X2 [Tarenaya hassleriana]|uniref:uncharacterized membrane protein At1g06890 isoform X2 n=1 Tax=Tarenaya hassleriana TaxID=28532 RepID=UPI0008FCF74F|nr:PREDICTED: uncharacterized membrane protein At1g06890 isoform X2 [Tarenaya hassleriana]
MHENFSNGKIATLQKQGSLSLSSHVAGRALEELRSSLYNELKTSEGAKRQQQRFCGPFVSMSFNFMVAVGIILTNKLVMGRVGFNFPIFLTLIHYSIAWVLLAFFKTLSLLPVSPPSKTTPFSSIFSLGAVMAFASGLANTSLQHNSVGFYQMAKIAVTPTIVFAEFILLRKTISSEKVMALAVVSIGVAVATVTDLEFNLFGALVAIAWIIPSSVNKILWSNLQQQGNWTALALMWKTTPITVFFLLALMPWLDPPGVLLFKWDFGNSSAVLVSALLGFLLQWSGALALGATSATSHVVLGQFKTCVILLGGYVIFGSDPGFVSISGAVVALAGMSVYTWLNLQVKSLENSTKPNLPMQNAVVSKPKSDADESGADTVVISEPVTSTTNSANIV